MAKIKKGGADSYTDYAKMSGAPSPATDYAGKPGKPDSYTQYKKGGVIKKKAKDGSSFGMLSVKAGIDKNPKPTFADKIAGAKKMAKSGKKVMKSAKMKMGGKAAKQAAVAIAMKKAGKAPKAMMKNGGVLSAPKKDGLSMQLGSYNRQIGKNYTGKNVVNKGAKAKMGKTMGKCKYGC